jgi:hypothetical protein
MQNTASLPLWVSVTVVFPLLPTFFTTTWLMGLGHRAMIVWFSSKRFASVSIVNVVICLRCFYPLPNSHHCRLQKLSWKLSIAIDFYGKMKKILVPVINNEASFERWQQNLGSKIVKSETVVLVRSHADLHQSFLGSHLFIIQNILITNSLSGLRSCLRCSGRLSGSRLGCSRLTGSCLRCSHLTGSCLRYNKSRLRGCLRVTTSIHKHMVG